MSNKRAKYAHRHGSPGKAWKDNYKPFEKKHDPEQMELDIPKPGDRVVKCTPARVGAKAKKLGT